jgi:hypothetical protein
MRMHLSAIQAMATHSTRSMLAQGKPFTVATVDVNDDSLFRE